MRGQRVWIGSVVAGAVVALAWTRSPVAVSPPIVVTVAAPAIPPAQVVVEAPAPAPAPPPAPRVEPPVIGTRCVADVATIGVPIHPPVEDIEPAMGPLQGATVDPSGCTIAAWTGGELVASWDGGQTFATFEIDGTIDAVAAAAGRIAILRDRNALGTVRAGSDAIVWRDIGVLATPDEESPMTLSAAGRWTVISRGSDRPRAPGRDDSAAETTGVDALLGITDSDGATWRFVVPPDAQAFRVTADGRISATQTVISADGESAASVTEHRYLLSLPTARWRKDGAIPHDDSEPAWTYAARPGTRNPCRDWPAGFWECGGSDKILAFHGRRTSTVAGRLNGDVYPIQLAASPTAAYAVYNSHLHRLRGARSVDLGELPYSDRGHLVGVDQYDSALAFDNAHVLRWSERGGWRVLWTAPERDGDD